MGNYAKGTSVSVSQSQNHIRIMLMKEGADGVAIAETKVAASVQFVFESMPYKFHIVYPSMQDTSIKLTPTGLVRTGNQREVEINKETKRLWRALVLYIKAAIEAHTNGLVDLKRSLMGNLMLKSGETMYSKLESNLSLIESNPRFLLGEVS